MFVAALLAVACDAGESLTAEEFARRLLRASSDVSTRCVIRPVLPGSSLESSIAVGDDVARDVARELATLVEEGRLVYDSVAATRCLAAIEERECEPSDALGVPWAPDACAFALRGAVADGAACESSPECASGVCDASDATCPGRCLARHPEGGPCASIAECEQGLSCESGRCARGLPAGSTCTTILPLQASCDRGLVCLDLSIETEGACVVPRFTAGDGEPCGGADGALCRADLVCALAGPSGGRCEPRYERDGECRASFPEGCPDGQICAPAERGQRCTELPREGEPCLFAGSTFPRCAAALRCIDDGEEERCRTLLPAGEVCSRGSECEAGVCEDGTCGGTLALSCAG